MVHSPFVLIAKIIVTDVVYIDTLAALLLTLSFVFFLKKTIPYVVKWYKLQRFFRGIDTPLLILILDVL